MAPVGPLATALVRHPERGAEDSRRYVRSTAAVAFKEQFETVLQFGLAHRMPDS